MGSSFVGRIDQVGEIRSLKNEKSPVNHLANNENFHPHVFAIHN
jgi:hypothetical protein